MKSFGAARPVKATRRNMSMFSHTMRVCITAHIILTAVPP